MMVQSWLTFSGILVDLIGFLLLAWDLWPRYRKDQEIRHLEAAQRNLINMFAAATDNDEQIYVNDRQDLTRKVIKAWKKFGWAVPDHIEVNPDAVEVLTEADAAYMLPKINQIIGQRRMMLDLFDEKPRPPLGFAIVLILVGFLMQIAGSFPL